MKGVGDMIFAMVKLLFLIMFIYLLLQMIKKHNPNSTLLEVFEFLLGLLEGFLFVCGLAVFMLFVLGILIIL